MYVRRLTVALATLSVVVLLIAARPLAAAENDGLDPSFGGFGAGGLATLPFDVVALARQPDGKLLAAGTQDGGFAVARLLDSGALDQAFGQGGLAMTRFGEGRQIATRDLALQDDGKLVVAGELISGERRFYALARYTAAGAPDASFDGDGALVLDLNGEGERVAALAIDRAGRLLVGGWSTGEAGDDFVVVRLRPDGERDESFDGGGDGERRFDFGGQDRLRDMLVQSDGKLVLLGDNLPVAGGGRFALARLNADGTSDQGFGKAGFVLTSFGTSGRASSIALQGDKLVAVGGGSTEGFLLARYEPNGALDHSFDQDGVILAPLGSAGAFASAVVPLSDGQLIVVGRGTQDLAIARFESNGAFAPWFGDQGRLLLPTAAAADAVTLVHTPDGRLTLGNGRGLRRLFADGSADAGGRQVAAPMGDLDPLARRIVAAVLGQVDGGLLTVGTVAAFTPKELEFALAVTRHLPNGQPDRGFGAGGELILNLPETLEIASDALLQPDGKLVIVGTSGGGKEAHQLLLLRLLPDGRADRACSFERILSLQSVAGATAALQPDGKLIVAGAVVDGEKRSTIVTARFLADCRLDTSFGAGGTVLLDTGVQVLDALALPDGKTVLAGVTRDGLFMVRLDVSGKVDRDFGDDGTVALPLTGIALTGAALAGERILVSAYQNTGARDWGLLLGFRSDGRLDPSFGVEGTTSVEVRDVANTALAWRDDGVIALVTCPEETSASNVAVFTADGKLDRTFSDDGQTALEIGGSTCLQAARFSGGRLIVAGLAGSDATSSFGLAGYALGSPRELGFIPPAGPVREGERTTLTVRLSQTAAQTVTVRYAAESGSATNGVDFRLPPGTLTFAPGQTSQSISVPILADGAIEPDESVTVALSAPANAVLGQNARLMLTIHDAERPDDPRGYKLHLPLVRR